LHLALHYNQIYNFTLNHDYKFKIIIIFKDIWILKSKRVYVATLLRGSVRMKFTLPNLGLGSPLGLSKFQSLILGVKTPHIGMFFISLESYWSVDGENGLAWAIWTFTAQVMEKRKAGSQIGNLTRNHQKSGIDPTPMRVGEMRCTLGKLSRRATSLLQTSSQLEVWAKSYDRSKSRESKLGQFRDSSLGVPGQKAIRMCMPRRGTEYTTWGKVVASPESKPWWVKWVQVIPWFVPTPKRCRMSSNPFVGWIWI